MLHETAAKEYVWKSNVQNLFIRLGTDVQRVEPVFQFRRRKKSFEVLAEMLFVHDVEQGYVPVKE
jgi:hypothetical protein